MTAVAGLELKRKIKQLAPPVLSALAERLRGRRSSSTTRPRIVPTTAGGTTRLPSLPSEQEGGEWKVVQPKMRKKRQRRRKKAKATEKEGGKDAVRVSPARGPQAKKRTEGHDETKCCQVSGDLGADHLKED
jgi:hypothetical protein